MPRLQLFEVLDQRWCPQAVLHGATDYLEAITSRADIYRPLQEDIFRAIDDCGAARVVDLCSGGGGPLRSRLGADPQLSCARFSVDAACVPPELRGFRTVFSSFHHFPDSVARAVLADAVQ